MDRGLKITSLIGILSKEIFVELQVGKDFLIALGKPRYI